MKTQKYIEITGARQHNLQNLSVKIPKEAFTVVTGPSGSGKSSLAFDTLFAEGQRRYMESLSTYARQFLDKQEKPDVDEIKGLSPTIAIEQKNHTKNSRSTVGTATEIYDYLRLLFAKCGVMYCPDTGELVKKNLVQEVSQELIKKHSGARAYVLFPLEFSHKTKVQDRKRVLALLVERGFTQAFLSGKIKKGEAVEPLDLQEQVQAKSTPLTGKSNQAEHVLISVDRMSLELESRGRLEDALMNAYSEGLGRARVYVLSESGELSFEGRYTDYPSTDAGERRYPELTPVLFSFNSPMGACEKCKGFGNILRIDPNLVVPHPQLSIAQGALEPLTKPSLKSWLKEVIAFCQAEKISLTQAWAKLSDKDRKKIWEGSGDFGGIEGLFEELEADRYKMQIRVFISRYRSPQLCTACKGQRLRPEARSTLFRGLNIGQLCELSIEKLAQWFKELKLSAFEKEVGKDVFPQIASRLDFLLRVGLDYLTLNRLAKTLSGGEAQRIALANQLGSRLTQTCYVLDEPSIGLHPRDTERLIGILKDLVALKNTVVDVEHDPDIIQSSEQLIDLGPEAGEKGGKILYAGPFKDFIATGPKESLTRRFLVKDEAVPVPMRRRMDRFKDRSRGVKWLTVTDCTENNLKDVELKVPLGMFTCVTGVSGSGKSSAVRRTLYPALAKVYLQRVEEVGRFKKIMGFEELKSVNMIDQSPIGRSPRSNPITFMKNFDDIRALFSSTIEARKRRFHPGHFSFNVPGGRCEACEGDGYQRIEMIFMEDVFLKCDVCEGKRFKPEVLEIQYNKKNIHEVLNMTVAEARRFFSGEVRLTHTLTVLENVGLGYVHLGQASNTLSGGESQRLKIARELAAADSSGVLYILDEPTTGLHFRDVKILLRVLHQLVERGNTVLVIEHNLDVMKSADWMIDFGPEGGERGGKIVFEGTPEELVKGSKGFTAKHLKPVLEGSPKIAVPELLEVPAAGA
jgi:excinuclease ABC subunit A